MLPTLSSAVASLLFPTNPTVMAIIANGEITRDQFAEDLPVPPLRDRVLVLPIDNGKQLGGDGISGFYVYEGGRLIIHPGVTQGSDILNSINQFGTTTQYWSEITVYSHKRLVGSYIGTNVYGVTAKVQTYRVDDIILSFDERFENRGYKSGVSDVSILLPPDEARALAEAAKLEITLVSGTEISKPAICTTNLGKPTINLPIELLSAKCRIHVDVERVRIIDARTGQTISEIYDRKKGVSAIAPNQTPESTPKPALEPSGKQVKM